MTMVPRKMQSRAIRHIFSASDDTVMTKQISATHAPIEEHVDVRPLLNVVQDIFHRATSLIPDILQGKQTQMSASKENANQSDLSDILEISYHTINKIACEISCKCMMGGGDAHATTIGILGMLSSFSWDAKVGIALAAFASNLGEFWLVAQLNATNRLAKSVALLKHIHETLEQVDDLGPKFETVNNLLNAMFVVANCIVEFHELPSQYIDHEAPEMLTASTLIPSAVYWTIRSIVACASHILGIIGLGQGYMTSTIETWELSSLTHKLDNMNDHLQKQLTICHQHLDDNKQREAFQTLEILFETSHQDNINVLKALIRCKDDPLPLFDGSTKQRVSIDVLRSKIVLLYITDLQHISEQELVIFGQMYQDSRQDSTRLESQYELVWIPIVEKGTLWTESKQRFERLQSMMPWYSVYDPSVLEAATIRYIKEVWLFNTKHMLVVLDPQGKVVNLNAIHVMWIWGSLAYPFSSLKEEALWKEETWGLALLADTIDESLFEWVSAGKYICLYGGDDIEWIRKFTSSAKSMAKTLQIPLEIMYVGKSNPGEKIRKINKTINEEKLSNVLAYPTINWFFWVRLESMWHSKLQQGNTVENDQIMLEIVRILSFDSSDQGWAVISQGTVKMTQGKGDSFLKCVVEFEEWKDNAKDKGVLAAMDDYIQGIQTPHHCNRLILPGVDGRTPEQIICAECRQPMEKFYMYRCCNE
ncbi:protein SIEVE ELEMENT OCCLUSION B-like isoform X2 [Cicer arietinum]|uniref:Protein SIEVE ELEMENT OCCLUSION B-like isoform X2 n=1 Tax=Cicer arietinum TaxID=3827 RepID=A0A1S2YFR0_CICAR|nr:protein SIEVE ELEMENT OCCLUSION B-like isoform X2 [Cicer arietinum]